MKSMTIGFACVLVLGIGTAAWTQEIHANFRRAKIDQGEFNWDGLNAEKFITPDVEGLRWRFTKDMAPKQVGISWKTRIDGDFTATATYNIERVDRPAQGSGVGVEMYLTLDTPEPRDAIVFTRVLQPGGEAIHNFFHMTNDERKNRLGKLISRQAATPRSLQGRLRVARNGKTFVASIAEAADDEFKEIGRQEIGAMRVQKLRFAGIEGGCEAPELDMRLVEIQLVEKYLAAVTKPPTSQKAAPAPQENVVVVTPVVATPSGTSNLWIIIILGGVFLLSALGVIALIVVVRMSRGK